MRVFTGHTFAINEDNVIVMNLKKHDDGVNLLESNFSTPAAPFKISGKQKQYIPPFIYSNLIL